MKQSRLLFKIIRMNGHFMGFHQLVQKFERITPTISTLQDNQSDLTGFRKLVQKLE